LALSLVLNNYFDFTVTASERLTSAFLLVIGSMVASIVLCVIFGNRVLKTSTFQRLVLQDEQRSGMGYTVAAVNPELIEKTGIAKTDLRPSGKIEIDGKWYDAVSLEGFVEKGQAVKVEKQENYNIFIRKAVS